jgi:integrase
LKKLNVDAITIKKLFLSDDLKSYSSKDIEPVLLNITASGQGNTNTNIYTFAQDFIAMKKKKATREIYEYTISTMKKFDDNIKYFHQIDYIWLKHFENYLDKTGMAINSISVHLRNIRAIWNEAARQKIVSKELYPFKQFQIKQEETAKRSVPLDILIKIRDIKLTNFDDCLCRDIFMLVFYLIGINMIDLCSIKQITNGRIEYRRSKSSGIFSLKVEPEAMAIIEKYKGLEYLLNISDRYKNHKNFLKKMNKFLKQFYPGLSSYWARHTWASTAANLDIPKETIAASLGHKDGSVTGIYIQFNRNKIDGANRKVIDYVNNYKMLKN